MSLSTIIKQICPSEGCGKIAVELTRVKLGNSHLITLECGHLITEGSLKSVNDTYESIISSDSRRLMPYQIDGVKFLESAGGRAILADEQGLGKTVQALALLKLHRAKLLPAVILAKTTIKIQWHHEIIRWCGQKGFLTQVIGSSKEFCAPGFQIYVVTYDMAKNDKIFEYVKDEIKTVIIDECQVIKNHLSERAKAVQRLCANVEHIIPMSGTPIKNNAGEYFTVLNLVKPKRYPHYSSFIQKDCDSYNNGWGFKVGGLKNPAKFAEDTKDFILRRTKEQVLPDLPKFSRRFQHVELDGKVKKVYLSLIAELDDLLYNDEMNAMERSSAQIAIMSKMRHITGLSKVEACADATLEFLESSDRKITIGTHHQDVADLLIGNLKQAEISPLHLHSGLSAEARANLIKKFEHDSSSRVLIASTLAAGEGLNIQFCADAILLERQWNPANEEQFEARFHRFGQKNPVTVNYMIVSETIDEFFTELVEQKRAIVAGALDNKQINWNESSLMSELAMILVTKGKKAWKL